MFDQRQIEGYLTKWQRILRLQDWDIRYHPVNMEWRKTGNIKIDTDDRKAVLMLNNHDPKQTNIEGVVIHELIHLKLWGMDQMLEEMIKAVFGKDPEDPKYGFAMNRFFELLETTVEDLAKGYAELGADDPQVSFGRVMKQVEKELEK